MSVLKQFIYKTLRRFVLGKSHAIFNIYKNSPNYLDELFDIYGSDKGGYLNDKSHDYSTIYSLLFNPYRNREINLFECGIGSNKVESFTKKNNSVGASLKVWKKYFVNGNIYGADIDKDLLFTESRIITTKMDQTSFDSILKSMKKFKVKFDIVIDDGLHKFFAGRTLFLGLKSHLNSEFIYIIEDVAIRDVYKYKKFFDSEKVNFSVIDFSKKINGSTNHRLIVVTSK